MGVAKADEGFWTTSQSVQAKREFERKYGLHFSDRAVGDSISAAVQLGGGSGSFVSQDGLLLTNFHVADSDWSEFRDKTIFAPSLEEEIKVKNIAAKRVIWTFDVTQVLSDLNINLDNLSTAERASVSAEIFSKHGPKFENMETECRIREETQSSRQMVMTCYEVFTDIRAVFIPSASIASFGFDNVDEAYSLNPEVAFRYHLDFALLRVYKNGKPYRPPTFLKFDLSPVLKHQPVMMAGFPWHTARAESALKQKTTFESQVEKPFAFAKASTTAKALRAYIHVDPRRAAEVNMDGKSLWQEVQELENEERSGAHFKSNAFEMLKFERQMVARARSLLAPSAHALELEAMLKQYKQIYSEMEQIYIPLQLGSAKGITNNFLKMKVASRLLEIQNDPEKRNALLKDSAK